MTVDERELIPFTFHCTCVKCGLTTNTILITHKTEYNRATDQIVRTCGRCGYEWRQVPLDRSVKS